LRNFAALTKGETFRILYNKKKYDIGVVEVRGELGHFAPGAAEAVCIIEVHVSIPFLLIYLPCDFGIASPHRLM
jgi:hypothetical protein